MFGPQNPSGRIIFLYIHCLHVVLGSTYDDFFVPESSFLRDVIFFCGLLLVQPCPNSESKRVTLKRRGWLLPLSFLEVQEGDF